MACANLAAKEEATEVDDGKAIKWRSLETCRRLHLLAEKRGWLRDLFVGSTLVDGYAKCGSVEEAWNVFERMPWRDLVTWNAMILGFAENGEGDRALECFERLQQPSTGLEPDFRTFTAAIVACASLGAKEVGREIQGKVVKLESLAKAMDVHSRAARMGCCRSDDVFLLSSLVAMYAKCGSMVDANRVFDRMPARTAVSWTSLIAGYVENGDDEIALKLFFRMRSENCEPIPRTFVAALMACASLAALETGRKIHRDAASRGFEDDLYFSTTVVDFYGKCGSMEEAEEAFRSMAAKNRNRVAWSALISGYSRIGDTDNAFATFSRMEAAKVAPCAITFVSLLSACSHAGMVDRGRELFAAMVSRYGIAPRAEHYNCVVDMLGRTNLLEEAAAMLAAEQRPRGFVPNLATWKIVLGACHKWRNVELARTAFEAVVQLDPTQDVAYVVMASLLGGAEMWEEQARVLEMRRKAGTWKKAGRSWWSCEETGVVHSFRAGEAARHPQRDAIAAKLAEVVAAMKARRGYVAATRLVTHNIAEAEKEGALCCHSERLAIACALVNTAAGTPLRIVKNLRVCEDCHAATAMISEIERRVIVCRDTSRFHVFRDGACSCNNFW